ncbi:acyltransferase family protein [Anaerobium acetethylicum]|uniref:Acyltransferase family protein n=1 Tax=Anaerobium acetethylicum TaxID=1619234 RepID=A0A1D3TRA4_9FIRM|nr:Acyltransferase family protein [Anaerobium acetethylicum]
MDKYQSKLLKVFAIMLMVFHHCFAFPDRISNTFVVSTSIQKLAEGCRLCVPIFIIISGYGFGRKILNDKISWKYSLVKTVQFYSFYWFIMIITLPYGFIGGGVQTRRFFVS